jgi:hypothetical protein
MSAVRSATNSSAVVSSSASSCVIFLCLQSVPFFFPGEMINTTAATLLATATTDPTLPPEARTTAVSGVGILLVAFLTVGAITVGLLKCIFMNRPQADHITNFTPEQLAHGVAVPLVDGSDDDDDSYTEDLELTTVPLSGDGSGDGAAV